MVTWNFSIEVRQIYYSSSTQYSTIYLSDESIRKGAKGKAGTDTNRKIDFHKFTNAMFQ